MRNPILNLASFLFFALPLCGVESIVLEAEDGILTGVFISSDAAGYSGSGYVKGFRSDADKVQWEFNASQGFYELVIGYRTPSGEKGFGGSLNGVGLTGHFPANDSFSVFKLGRVYLQDGINHLEIGGGWNWYEIDYASFTPMDAPSPPLPVDTPLVNPNATPRTLQLMDYLKSEYGKITLSGQYDESEVAIIQNVTGLLPAIFNEDLINYSPSRILHGANPDGLTESVIQMGQAGYILSLSWHWNAPMHLTNTAENPWWSGFYTRATSFDIEQTLANPESEEYQLLISDMDTIATELKKLQAADLPILWRPLHESEGGWFWWGAKGPEPFKELWRLLYNRYTYHHQLDNLIWVLTSEDPDWYPGDDVVDIVGVDAYPDDRADPLVSNWEAVLERFDGRKLIALTEFGGVPDIQSMQFLGVWWSFFTSWTGDLGPGSMSSEELQRIYTAPEVLTFDELPHWITTPNWAGFAVDPTGWVNTDNFLSWIHVARDPYIYSKSFDGWIYVPSTPVPGSGTWIYVYR